MRKEHLVKIAISSLCGCLAGLLLWGLTLFTIYKAHAVFAPEGWQVSYTLGRSMESSNHLERASTALIGLGALVAEEALYYTTFKDADGKPLAGIEGPYRIHFDAGELPEAGAFWSITLYGADSYLVENKARRYGFNSHRNGLQFNPDGSLDILVAKAQPQNEATNWIPAPQGAFSLTLRAYLPGKTLLSGAWMPPPVINTRGEN